MHKKPQKYLCGKTAIKILIIIFFNLFFTVAGAETYFISNNGNDANDGLSRLNAIKTIARLNTLLLKLNPGDEVLFERGGIYAGQVNIVNGGNASYPVIFGAYGNGNLPVITGSERIGNWSRYNNNILSADVNFNVENFFFNGRQMILARFPNSGFLTTGKPLSNPNTGFTDSKLTNQNGYWKGSNVRIRTLDWAFEFTKIKDYANKTFVFQEKTAFPVIKGWGYYLDNKFELLDAWSEWYYDSEKKKIFFYTSPGIDPNHAITEGSTHIFGFFAKAPVSNIIFRDLEIKNQTVSGICFAKSCSKIIIQDCTFYGQLQAGISLINVGGISVAGCRFSSINGVGINIEAGDNINISGSIFKNIGMIPGYGVAHSAFSMSGIVLLNVKNSKITNNFLDSIGHDAINTTGSNIDIERNIINNVLLLLNDGGAIKCFGAISNNSVWQNNFIYNVKGNLEGTDKSISKIIAAGIYIDDLGTNIKILNNTISKCGLSGIKINNGKDNLVQGNICYDNYSALEFYHTRANTVNNLISGNIFYSNGQEQYPVIVNSQSGNFNDAVFDGNYYINSQENLFVKVRHLVMEGMSYEKWKAYVGNKDKNAVVISGKDALYPKLFINLSNDSSKFILGSAHSYRNLNQKSLYGSVTLKPFTSEILFSDINLKDSAELIIAGGSVDFGKTGEGTESRPRWYLLNMQNLNSPVVITAPRGFLVSLNYNNWYSGSLQVNPGPGNEWKIIYVKFIPESSAGYYDFISNTSGNLQINIKVLGKGD